MHICQVLFKSLDHIHKVVGVSTSRKSKVCLMEKVTPVIVILVITAGMNTSEGSSDKRSTVKEGEVGEVA